MTRNSFPRSLPFLVLLLWSAVCLSSRSCAAALHRYEGYPEVPRSPTSFPVQLLHCCAFEHNTEVLRSSPAKVLLLQGGGWLQNRCRKCGPSLGLRYLVKLKVTLSLLRLIRIGASEKPCMQVWTLSVQASGHMHSSSSEVSAWA